MYLMVNVNDPKSAALYVAALYTAADIVPGGLETLLHYGHSFHLEIL